MLLTNAPQTGQMVFSCRLRERSALEICTFVFRPRLEENFRLGSLENSCFTMAAIATESSGFQSLSESPSSRYCSAPSSLSSSLASSSSSRSAVGETMDSRSFNSTSTVRSVSGNGNSKPSTSGLMSTGSIFSVLSSSSAETILGGTVYRSASLTFSTLRPCGS